MDNADNTDSKNLKMESHSSPTFVLVTTCMNEIDSVERWIQDIENQTVTVDEIVVVDAESTDGTADILQDWASKNSRVTIVSKKSTVSQGRNHAIEVSNASHFISTDMGVSIPANWVEDMTKPVRENPDIHVVMGAYHIDPSKFTHRVEWVTFYLNGRQYPFLESDGKLHLVPGVVPGNRSVVYSKELWRKLGKFPEDLTRCADDSVFGRQVLEAGISVVLVDSASVSWERFKSTRAYLKESFGYGLGGGEANIKKPIAVRWHESKRLPGVLVPVVTGLRAVFHKRLLKGLARSLRNLDVISTVWMPFMAYQIGHQFGKGYLEGSKRGEVHCQECRARLKQSAN